MDNTNTLKESAAYTTKIKQISSVWVQVGLGFLLAFIIGYTGYLVFSLTQNIAAERRCKNKPSATDATITCPKQSQKLNGPFYTSSSGEKIPITNFYGAVNSLQD